MEANHTGMMHLESTFGTNFFELCDLLLCELEDRFEQRELLPPSLSLENILLKAANGEVYEEAFQMAKISCCKDDIKFDHLQKQLPLCTDLI